MTRKVDLTPDEVDFLVFWSRNPSPLFPHFPQLRELGYSWYILFTLMDNPPALDPKCPKGDAAIRLFLETSERLGPQSVIWRYDPLVLSNIADAEFHCRTFERIAAALEGKTHRVIFSFMQPYKKTRKRLKDLEGQGVFVREWSPEEQDQTARFMSECARAHGMEILACADEVDRTQAGIAPGCCIDAEYIRRHFGITVAAGTDPHQRKHCGCEVSKDIGMYDSCLYECRYCYGTSSFARARKAFAEHDPLSPSMLGRHRPPPEQGSLLNL